MNPIFFIEKDLWKKKYLMEKKQNTAPEEQNNSVIFSSFFKMIIFFLLQKNATDIDHQLAQAKIRLNNSTKVYI